MTPATLPPLLGIRPFLDLSSLCSVVPLVSWLSSFLPFCRRLLLFALLSLLSRYSLPDLCLALPLLASALLPALSSSALCIFCLCSSVSALLPLLYSVSALPQIFCISSASALLLLSCLCSTSTALSFASSATALLSQLCLCSCSLPLLSALPLPSCSMSLIPLSLFLLSISYYLCFCSLALGAFLLFYSLSLPSVCPIFSL